jgi:hypothetical protein
MFGVLEVELESKPHYFKMLEIAAGALALIRLGAKLNSRERSLSDDIRKSLAQSSWGK